MGLTRVVIKFDLSQIPEKAKITKATLLLHFFDTKDWKKSGNVLAFKLTTPWSEDGALPSWTEVWNNPGGDFDSTKLAGTGHAADTGWCKVVLDTTVLQDFIESPETNFGYILIPERDSGEREFGGKVHLCEAGYSGAYLGSEGNGKFAPKLKVTYEISTHIKNNNKFVLFTDELSIVNCVSGLKFNNIGEGDSDISIFSTDGRLVYNHKKHNSATSSFTLPFNRKGVFMVLIENKSGSIIRKVVAY